MSTYRVHADRIAGDACGGDRLRNALNPNRG